MGRGGEGEAVEVDWDGRGVPFADVRLEAEGQVLHLQEVQLRRSGS